MATVQKDAVLQIRLPADLLESYKTMCAEMLIPVSVKLRQHILEEVRQWERVNEGRGGVGKASEPSAPPVAVEPRTEARRPRETLDQAPKLSRRERREMERDQRKGR